MNTTPKLKRKTTLSLGGRLNKKRHSASPQSRQIAQMVVNNNHNTAVATPRSPNVLGNCSDAGIESTPTHKKPNLDDSLDYSPRLFDLSGSPSPLQSQTLAIDSAEVGWRWTRTPNSRPTEAFTKTPDSAYADESVTSVGSNSAETTAVRTRGDKQRQRFYQEQRKTAKELELRRAEKARADELLKKRCEKLQAQLRDVSVPKMEEKKIIVNTTIAELPKTTSSEFTKCCSVSTEHTTRANPITIEANPKKTLSTPNTFKANNTFNDFLNDSDSDCLLLEVTQQLESKVVKLSQNVAPLTDSANKSHSNAATSTPHTNSKNVLNLATTSSTPTSSSKQTRCSLYMKFLEDETPDDWFISLDEAILQATQEKKPRTSFQRYKSMPTDTKTTTATAGSAAKLATVTTMTRAAANSSSNQKTAENVFKIKRHASSHALSPSSSSSSKHYYKTT